MTNPDWTPEEEEAFNAVEKHSNLGKQILRDMGQPYHFEKREWVGLTEEDKESFWTGDQMSPKEWDELYAAVEAKLKEKNT
jgi:hypothetical protein